MQYFSVVASQERKQLKICKPLFCSALWNLEPHVLTIAIIEKKKKKKKKKKKPLPKHMLKTTIQPHHAKMCLQEFSTRYDSNQPAHL